MLASWGNALTHGSSLMVYWNCIGHYWKILCVTGIRRYKGLKSLLALPFMPCSKSGPHIPTHVILCHASQKWQPTSHNGDEVAKHKSNILPTMCLEFIEAQSAHKPSYSSQTQLESLEGSVLEPCTATIHQLPPDSLLVLPHRHKGKQISLFG